MGFFSKIFKGVKKVVKQVAPIATSLMGWGGGIIPAAAGGLVDMYGAKEQNKANSAQALRSMEFSGVEAQKQRDFQERMSNSAHQRQITDLKKAGLNPILSATSGASSPGGAMGSGAQAPMVNEEEAAIRGVSSAMAIKQQSAQIAKIKADTRLTDAQREAIKPVEGVGAAAGTLWEYLQQKGASTAKAIQYYTNEWYEQQSKIRFNKGYRPNPQGSFKITPKSGAEAYPLGTRPNPLKPPTKSSKPQKKYLNMGDYSIEYFTRTYKGKQQWKFKNTPWLSRGEIVPYTQKLKKGMKQ